MLRILLIIYDNESHISFFPQGLAYIASVALKEGYFVQIYNQDVHHYSDEHLTFFLDNNDEFDVIGINVISGYYQYRKLLSICAAINKSKKRPRYLVLGGHGPTPEPVFFLRKTNADIVVMGEGEETAKELFSAIQNGMSFNDIAGISYEDKKKYIINDKREIIEDVDAIPFPAYDLFPIECYRLIRFPRMENTDFAMPVLSGRGCKFSCTFCSRWDGSFRPRSSEKILEEIGFLQEKYGINFILFSDELLMSSEERVVSLCNAFKKHKPTFKWICNGRLNYAKKNVLKLMKESGCCKINYGIESMDDEVLKKMKKALTVKIITKGIENTLEVGISPGLNIIFGNIGDTKEILDKGVDFLLKYGDGVEMRTIRPVTPYPGSPLYNYAIEKGFLKDCRDFYENKHINSDLLSVNFTDMSDDDFHKALYEANEKLMKRYFTDMYVTSCERAKKLYFEKDASFRGFRRV